MENGQVTEEDLRAIMPYATPGRIAAFLPHLIAAMAEFEIETPEAQSAFLAQIAHESGSLKYVQEIASGIAYENRSDLGNTDPGDGMKFKGRGLIQITGRANYRECGEALGLDLLSNPELLEQPENACRSAAWFWDSRNLTQLAERDTLESFRAITKRINGGLNGWEDRLAYWKRAKAVLA